LAALSSATWHSPQFAPYLSDMLPKLNEWFINRVAEITATGSEAAYRKVV